MPANFPAFWLKTVQTLLQRGDRAPWLDGIAELDIPVIQSGSGDASELNLIHIPTTDFEPNVLINNTAYPLALVDYTDDEVIVKLDKYQTEQTSISDDQIIGAVYDKVVSATSSHITAILKKKYAKAIHAIAPAANTGDTPVLVSSGRSGKYSGNAEIILRDPNGRLRLTYIDLVGFRLACTNAGLEIDGTRLVLCDEHWNDMLLDRDNFGDQLVNYKTGDVAPVIAGFKIYNYVACPYYSGTTKLAFGSNPSAGQYRASVAFYEGNIAKKTGMTKQYFSPASTDTEKQANTLNYRHYFMAVPKRARYIAAITSGTYQEA